MLGVTLFYVGIVLVSNGFYRIQKIQDKSNIVINLFIGSLGLFINIIAIGYGICNNKNPGWFYESATGLLFSFTYLYTVINTIFDFDQRLYGWYSLFVALNTIPAGLLCIVWGYGGNLIYGLIWWFWGVLWLTSFIECTLEFYLGKFVGYLSIIEGIFTAWIPGLLMLIELWPK